MQGGTNHHRGWGRASGEAKTPEEQTLFRAALLMIRRKGVGGVLYYSSAGTKGLASPCFEGGKLGCWSLGRRESSAERKGPPEQQCPGYRMRTLRDGGGGGRVDRGGQVRWARLLFAAFGVGSTRVIREGRLDTERCGRQARQCRLSAVCMCILGWQDKYQIMLRFKAKTRSEGGQTDCSALARRLPGLSRSP